MTYPIEEINWTRQDHIGLDRKLATVSGGESILIGLVGRLLQRPDVLILDEPTNNLDASAREKLYRAIDQFSGTVLVVSHDHKLLERMSCIAELYRGTIRMFSGNIVDYEAAMAIEQEAAQRQVRDAKAKVALEKKQLIETQTKLARDQRRGRNAQLGGGIPKIVANARRNASEVSGAKYRIAKEDDLAAAKEQLDGAADRVREENSISVDLPDTHVGTGRKIVSLTNYLSNDLFGKDGIDLQIIGPERIALSGNNGSGKTTLLREIQRQAQVQTSFLTQRLELLDNDLSMIDNLRLWATEMTPGQARNRLARFLFRKDKVFQKVGSLSGGERLRVALACVFSAKPAPQLLILDEPTNNLDMTSTRQLQEALHSYEGALIVVSHDPVFLENIGVTKTIELIRGQGIKADIN